MLSHDELVTKLLQNPQVRAEYEGIEREEMPMLDAILSVRKQAKLSQEEVARRMNVSPPVVSRLDRALLTGKPSPSLRTLQKYAQAVGKRVQIYTGECVRSQSRKASFMRLCQPAPVALKALRTSGL